MNSDNYLTALCRGLDVHGIEAIFEIVFPEFQARKAGLVKHRENLRSASRWNRESRRDALNHSWTSLVEGLDVSLRSQSPRIVQDILQSTLSTNDRLKMLAAIDASCRCVPDGVRDASNVDAIYAAIEVVMDEHGASLFESERRRYRTDLVYLHDPKEYEAELNFVREHPGVRPLPREQTSNPFTLSHFVSGSWMRVWRAQRRLLANDIDANFLNELSILVRECDVKEASAFLNILYRAAGAKSSVGLREFLSAQHQRLHPPATAEEQEANARRWEAESRERRARYASTSPNDPRRWNDALVESLHQSGMGQSTEAAEWARRSFADTASAGDVMACIRARVAATDAMLAAGDPVAAHLMQEQTMRAILEEPNWYQAANLASELMSITEVKINGGSELPMNAKGIGAYVAQALQARWGESPNRVKQWAVRSLANGYPLSPAVEVNAVLFSELLSGKVSERDLQRDN